MIHYAHNVVIKLLEMPNEGLSSQEVHPVNVHSSSVQLSVDFEETLGMLEVFRCGQSVETRSTEREKMNSTAIVTLDMTWYLLLASR